MAISITSINRVDAVILAVGHDAFREITLDELTGITNANPVLVDVRGYFCVQLQGFTPLKVPCITLMDTTGWPETVEDGWNVLVGTDRDKILKAVREFSPIGKQSNTFGDGKASQEITNVIRQLSVKVTQGERI